jgi:hypothetical protein
MAHYVFLDENNIVTEAFVGVDENELIDGIDPETWYGQLHNKVCKRTSKNTMGGVHTNGGTAFRMNYAGIGYTYNAEKDAFIPPTPYPSWILNEETCLWESPVRMPTLEEGGFDWDEEQLEWVMVRPPSN